MESHPKGRSSAFGVSSSVPSLSAKCTACATYPSDSSGVGLESPSACFLKLNALLFICANRVPYEGSNRWIASRHGRQYMSAVEKRLRTGPPSDWIEGILVCGGLHDWKEP
jgi:hypothetical protein